MELPPLSPVPPPGKRPGLQDLGWLAYFCARGFFELVRARLAFVVLHARDIPQRNKWSRERAVGRTVCDPAMIARIHYILPRLSARLPWRSDCLIQAIAGQNWLASAGLASEIRIGVRRHHVEDFGAHAWLIHDGHIISGGDISSYELLLGRSESL